MSQQLTWDITHDADRTVVKLCGNITEEARFSLLADALEGKTRVDIDLEGVRRINSAGVREWIKFIKPLSQKADVNLVRCSPAVVDQLNVISNFFGEASVCSILAPFLCDPCDQEGFVPVELDGSPRLPPPAPLCPSCGKEMEFDDLVDHYFRFIHFLKEGTV